MSSAIALKTGTGPGTTVGEDNLARTSHNAKRHAIERILGNVVIANEISGDDFQDAVANYIVNELEILILHGDLIRVPCLYKIRLHLLAEQRPFCGIIHFYAGSIF